MSEAVKTCYSLKPIWEENTVTAMEVTMESYIQASAWHEILTRTVTAASIPCAAIVDDSFSVTDENGVVKLVYAERQGQVNHVKIGAWTAERDIIGKLSVKYTVTTRVLPENYTSSPYFDFRAEEGGANGAFWTVLMFPSVEKMDCTLEWDLSAIPKDAQAITDFGVNTPITGEQTIESLGFSYFAVGLPNIWRDPNYEDFAFVWFGKAGFEVEPVARYVEQLYKHMSLFFEEPDTGYTVYARRDPFIKSGGGTALGKAFMFGYSDANPPSLDSIKNLLAHEMVHRWPHLSDDTEDVVWYNEGTAEFYCCELPRRFGLITEDEFAAAVNAKLNRYYENPYIAMPASEASQLYWTKRETQRLPYGRGLIYMIETDALIREKSGNKYSLDNVVLDILHMTRSGEKPNFTTWFERVNHYSGENTGDLRKRYDYIQSGALKRE